MATVSHHCSHIFQKQWLPVAAAMVLQGCIHDSHFPSLPLPSCSVVCLWGAVRGAFDCVWGHMEARGQCLNTLFYSLHLTWGQSVSLNMELTNWDPPVSTSSSRITAIHHSAQLFMWVLRFEPPRSSCLHSNHSSSLSHLPSPCICTVLTRWHGFSPSFLMSVLLFLFHPQLSRGKRAICQELQMSILTWWRSPMENTSFLDTRMRCQRNTTTLMSLTRCFPGNIRTNPCLHPAAPNRH